MCFKRITVSITLLLSMISGNLFSQTSSDGLKLLLDSTRKERNDSIRKILNEQFYRNFLAYLREPGFSTDSLNTLNIGKTSPEDKKFSFFNWNIQQNDGSNLYCGIIYIYKNQNVIPLGIKPSEQTLKKDSIYSLNDWPPALYFRVIGPKTKKDNYYLLFGWDRFSRQTSRKSIEAVSFPGDTSVVFGKEVFKTKEGKAKRIAIEYASTASLTLQYSKQKLTLTGVRKRYRNVNDSIIIFDRLAPLNEELEGMRWAYVPVGNIYDGYIYFKDYWTFVEGINARNPAIKREDRKKFKKPDLDLLPSK
ncbi:MAG TPA: hypothetical protein VK212_06705 [Lentimicrobium sp.]|nr:hypothetical protein [Lentimicrobium sp.]